jgi:D-beta-D-heptose 7-phosphate kinase/D-beta-D-heptose 1-phosphate adenosyltransferase
MARIAVVGDVLLDRDLDGEIERLCPDAPVPVVSRVASVERPGGAGLAALLARRFGHDVTLLTCLGSNEASALVRSNLMAEGADVVSLVEGIEIPEKVRIRSGAHAVARVDIEPGRRPDPASPIPPQATATLRTADAVLVADYGRGVTDLIELRRLISELAAVTPVVWDPHPLGCTPIDGAWMVTPNRAEVDGYEPSEARGLSSVAARAATLVSRWSARCVVVTLGSRGALLSTGTEAPFVVPAQAADGDTCGAGDAFAVAAAGALAAGALLSEAVGDAVQSASRYVACGGPAGLAGHDASPPAAVPAVEENGPTSVADAMAMIDRVRRAGGTVVAAGGCFDLVHAGHVGLLEQARGLGDVLIVCVNSDRSVRRLKGPRRPIVPEADRARLLRALRCVDAAVLFDESTPVTLLRRLRPDVFVKGGDYAGTELPEAGVLSEWGGQAVVMPYLTGRSTSRLAEEAFHD